MSLTFRVPKKLKLEEVKPSKVSRKYKKGKTPSTKSVLKSSKSDHDLNQNVHQTAENCQATTAIELSSNEQVYIIIFNLIDGSFAFYFYIIYIYIKQT